MVSTMKGPIPSHPYFDKDDPKDYLNLPAPRVRPEAQDIANKATGSVGVLLQIEGRRLSSAPGHRQKHEPRDHIQENVRRMRHIQKEVKKKQNEEPKPMPVKALWKSSKFDNVESKVKIALQEQSYSRPQSASSYLRGHSRPGSANLSRARPASARSVPVEKLTIPKAAETAREMKLVRHDIDFIKSNGQAARYSGMRRSPSLTALDDLRKRQEDEKVNYKTGQVPKYLQKRQKEWQKDEEERIANTPDPEMPEGHRLMSDPERRETLQKLEKSQREVYQQLSSMPIRTDTLRIRTRKEELERKLAEIEEAIKIFSRRKVFVKLDQ